MSHVDTGKDQTMSSKGKFYLLNPTVYDTKSADIAKLPPQQQKILRVMRDHCTETGMKGSDIVGLAVEKLNLETRQKYTVLYAWYARSNENYGVYTGHEKVEQFKTEDDLWLAGEHGDQQ
jgi:hypothetical protein